MKLKTAEEVFWGLWLWKDSSATRVLCFIRPDPESPVRGRVAGLCYFVPTITSPAPVMTTVQFGLEAHAWTCWSLIFAISSSTHAGLL